jgi:hypothetical protein
MFYANNFLFWRSGRNQNRQCRLSGGEKSGLLSAYYVAAANLPAVVLVVHKAEPSIRFPRNSPSSLDDRYSPRIDGIERDLSRFLLNLC